MVAASNLSIHSWQLMIHGEGAECLLCRSTELRGSRKASGSFSSWDRLITQCLQCGNAAEGAAIH